MASCCSPVPLAITLLSIVGASAAFASFADFHSREPADGRSATANGRTSQPPSIRAHRTEGPQLIVDGHLDDPAWRDPEAGYGFSIWEPNRGAKPTEETIFKVVYDDDAIYFGVACLESGRGEVASSLSRRDRIRDSDIVSIYLDPYLDRTTGYNFRVNPAGVQEDRYMVENGEADLDWDAVWEAETYADADGWYAEFRIPFSTIRYRPSESMTWGIQLYRYMHRRGEDTAWVVWDKEKSGFIGRFGTVTDIRGVRPPRQLEILPYVVQRTTDPDAPSEEDEIDSFQNFGADLKYGVTADLTLNATFQPDFGQVEADPATVNLSPFETFFAEKRPFFIEGSRFFEHPNFNLFYSRRIGTGDENARIRFASKLTGKTKGNFSVAALAATTDVTGSGQAHNFLKRGEQLSHYLVARVGRENRDGTRRLHIMQTAVLRASERQALLDTGYDEEDAALLSRDAYTTGLDFDLKSRDRTYSLAGAFVGSIVDPAPLASDPDEPHDARHGTGGFLVLEKSGGVVRGNIWGRWESDRLDLNDMGYLQAPDEITSGGWLQWRSLGRGENPRFNHANLNVNFYKNWLYAAGHETSDDTGAVLWSYGRGHRQFSGGNLNGYAQFRSFRQAWFGIWADAEGTDNYRTRGGPPMTVPARGGFWLGYHSDYRRRLSFEVELGANAARRGTREVELELGTDWHMSHSLSHSLALGLEVEREDAQYVDTIEHDDPTAGIGGSSYVFGVLDQRTLDLVLRSNVLFSRRQSLEIYLQPYLSVGDYTNPRELAAADTERLRPYAGADFAITDFDFRYAAVNLNLVYRWEYRPGSALFLVWTHAREEDEERRDFGGSGFDNRMRPTRLFRNEPENTFLAKLTYWFSL